MQNNILRCPACKSNLRKTLEKFTCLKCRNVYPIKGKIISLLLEDKINKKTFNSMQSYDKEHKNNWHRIDDGSYEILAAMARGNKTLDIACGDGFIEELAPETVGLEFSMNALLKTAKKKRVKNLIHADAESLPFKDNSFDLAICAGSLEHFNNPQTALNEMARVARIQVLTIHKSLPFPGSNTLRKAVLKAKGITDQPIEEPLSWNQIKRLYKNAQLNIVFKGVWTYPYNFDLVFKYQPQILKFPSCYFVISIRK